VIVAGWSAVPNTASYRIEVARDAEFAELVLREEVPSRVRAFRAEKLSPGGYFMRVRAIDRDDFLGIASETRAVSVSEKQSGTPSPTDRRGDPENRRAGQALRLGVTAPIVSPSPLINIDWWAPTRANAVALETAGYVRDRRFGLALGARASGAIGAFGLDARVATPEMTGPAADGSAWFRVRWRSVRFEGNQLELGPAAEIGVPLTTTSPPPRVGLGVGLGGADGRISWLANLGGRALLSEAEERQKAPATQGYVLLGGTYDALDWLRLYALLDAHALDHPEHDALAGRGGLSVGTELGERVFVGGSLRISPWDDTGGTLIGQLCVGIRDGG